VGLLDSFWPAGEPRRGRLGWKGKVKEGRTLLNCRQAHHKAPRLDRLGHSPNREHGICPFHLVVCLTLAHITLQEGCKDKDKLQVKSDHISVKLAAPTAAQVLLGDISAWIPNEHKAIIEIQGDPSEILNQFTDFQDKALEFLGLQSDVNGVLVVNKETLLTRGLLVLFCSRGLVDAEIYHLPLYSYSPLLFALQERAPFNYDSEEFSEANNIVKGLSFFEGLSQRDFFSQPGIELSSSIKAAVEKCTSARESHAAEYDWAPLHSQLVLDVCESIAILEESFELLPILRSVIAKFIKSAGQMEGPVELNHQKKLLEALKQLNIGQVRELRTFLLQTVSALTVLTSSLLSIAPFFNTDRHQPRGQEALYTNICKVSRDFRPKNSSYYFQVG
jgi:hypothetical protein